jgi:hypothetical protein
MCPQRWLGYLTLLILGIQPISDGYAQDSTLTFHGSLQLAVVNGDTPYWLQANQQGTIPSSQSFVSGNWGFYKAYRKASVLEDRIPFFNWTAGARLISNATIKKHDIFFTDLFLAFKAGAVELSFGQRNEFTGLCDSLLTSGSIAISNNARPYPRIQVAIPEFYNLHFLDDLLGVKVAYSDGLLGPSTINYGNVNHIPSTYLHKKELYLRIGRPWQKLNFYVGANHQAIWGGEEKIFSGGLNQNTAYKYVVFGKSWANSRVGNHFGTIDLAIELKASRWKLFLYRQNIYEDGSLAQFMNISDGLNGLSIKHRHFDPNKINFQIRSIVVELLSTKSQSGTVFDYDNGIFGADNYFNHYIFAQGWSYRGRTLGTPMIVPQNFMNDKIPMDSTTFTTNNRLTAFHLGINSRINGTDLQLLTTYSHNLGSYSHPFSQPIHQLSFLLKATRCFPRLFNSFLSASISADIGELYNQNNAFSISWTKKVILN